MTDRDIELSEQLKFLTDQIRHRLDKAEARVIELEAELKETEENWAKTLADWAASESANRPSVELSRLKNVVIGLSRQYFGYRSEGWTNWPIANEQMNWEEDMKEALAALARVNIILG